MDIKTESKPSNVMPGFPLRRWAEGECIIVPSGEEASILPAGGSKRYTPTGKEKEASLKQMGRKDKLFYYDMVRCRWEKLAGR